MEKSRIAALVDGIFAVAMTLLVLDLKLPEGTSLSSDPAVWRQLFELTGRFSTYALSFIVLGIFWIGHHSLFHFVRRVSRDMLWLNLLSHDQLSPSWIANSRLRTVIPMIIVVTSIAISFYNPKIAMSAYWLLLVFHFLPGKHRHPPEVDH